MRRFARHIAKAGDCWEWQGSRARKGYGRLNRGTGLGVILAHRLSWELWRGPIPEGLAVLHHCDNPPCVKPSHLFLGTIADNNRDMARKGRAARQVGERNGRARLTRDQVQAIRVATGPHKAVAAAYGIGSTTVRNIRAGERWKED